MNRLRNIAVLLCFSFVIAFPAYSQLKFDKPVLINKENGLPVMSFLRLRKEAMALSGLAAVKAFVVSTDYE
jgi:hypothetical protein